MISKFQAIIKTNSFKKFQGYMIARKLWSMHWSVSCLGFIKYRTLVVILESDDCLKHLDREILGKQSKIWSRSRRLVHMYTCASQQFSGFLTYSSLIAQQSGAYLCLGFFQIPVSSHVKRCVIVNSWTKDAVDTVSKLKTWEQAYHTDPWFLCSFPAHNMAWVLFS